MKALIQTVDDRPFAPRTWNDKTDVIAVLGRLVEERNRERVVATKRWVRNRHGLLEIELGLEKVLLGYSGVLGFDIEADYAGHSKFLGRLDEGTGAASRFDDHALG